MNRSITMLAATLATAAALAGCGKKEAPPAPAPDAAPTATAPAADAAMPADASAPAADPAAAPADASAPAADGTTPPAAANTTDRPQGGGEKL